jgi:putative PIN family toxin of toxin-antitoxin system
MGAIKVVRTVIDTNVVVSALLFGGTPGRLVSLWKSGRIKAFASKEIIDEYLRVFAYPQFNLSEQEIEYLIYTEILPYFDMVSLEPGSVIIEKDPSDDTFIHCALASGARIIISGDRHLLGLKKYGRIEILSATQFLKRF